MRMSLLDIETCLDHKHNICTECTDKVCMICYMIGIQKLLESLRDGKPSNYRINLAVIDKQPPMRPVYVSGITTLTTKTCVRCRDKQADTCADCSVFKVRQLCQLILEKKIGSMQF
ncbi:MAG: hypothetical protein SVY53_11455 [Chloroflexota bacterium]|nr:hypothetical protein [Chloroflexota bacterium]